MSSLKDAIQKATKLAYEEGRIMAVDPKTLRIGDREDATMPSGSITVDATGPEAHWMNVPGGVDDDWSLIEV